MILIKKTDQNLMDIGIVKSNPLLESESCRNQRFDFDSLESEVCSMDMLGPISLALMTQQSLKSGPKHFSPWWKGKNGIIYSECLRIRLGLLRIHSTFMFINLFLQI